MVMMSQMAHEVFMACLVNCWFANIHAKCSGIKTFGLGGFVHIFCAENTENFLEIEKLFQNGNDHFVCIGLVLPARKWGVTRNAQWHFGVVCLVAPKLGSFPLN